MQIKITNLIARRGGVSFSNSHRRRGMVFIKTCKVLARYAGYFFNCGVSKVCFLSWAGLRRDTGGISQSLRTQLAMIINSTSVEIYDDKFWISYDF
jgi:hypothetical protein